MEEYDLNKVCKALNVFLNEDLSNWYIRRNRRRFWASELDNSKKAVYQTTYEVLCGLCKMLAPIAPFAAEEIYTNLTGEESVHLATYPECDKSKFNDVIEERMDKVRDLISLGRNAREESKVKVRQPISEVILDGKNESTISDLVDLIKEELNVKEVIFETDLSQYMNFNVKPNFKEVGKVLGPKIKLFQEVLSNLSLEEINKLKNEEEVIVQLDGEDFTVTSNMVDIRVESKEGFTSSYEGNNFIVLNTTLTPELINEGIARELVSKVQNLRKSYDFDILDRIDILYVENSEFESAIENYIDFIKKETLCDNLVKVDNIEEVTNLNGLEVKFDVVKK